MLNEETAEGLSVEPADPGIDRERQNRSDGAAPDEAWRDLRRRFRLLWILLLASLPGTFVPALLLGGLISPKAALAVIALLWAVAIARAGWHIARFACPRCGLAFFESWIFLKLLRDRCAHCELPRNAVDLTPS
ncbi:MAG: hypothetical protein WBO23_14935 [Burkholderiales bacterium]